MRSLIEKLFELCCKAKVPPKTNNINIVPSTGSWSKKQRGSFCSVKFDTCFICLCISFQFDDYFLVDWADLVLFQESLCCVSGETYCFRGKIQRTEAIFRCTVFGYSFFLPVVSFIAFSMIHSHVLAATIITSPLL